MSVNTETYQKTIPLEHDYLCAYENIVSTNSDLEKSMPLYAILHGNLLQNKPSVVFPLPVPASPSLWSYLCRREQRQHPGLEWQSAAAVACSSQPSTRWSSSRTSVSTGRVILGHGLQAVRLKTRKMWLSWNACKTSSSEASNLYSFSKALTKSWGEKNAKKKKRNLNRKKMQNFSLTVRWECLREVGGQVSV